MTGNTDGPDADFCARDQFGQKDGTGSLVEYSARFLAAQVSSSQHSAQFVLNMAPFNFQPAKSKKLILCCGCMSFLKGEVRV